MTRSETDRDRILRGDLTDEEIDRLLESVREFSHYYEVCERRGTRQLWAWITGRL